MIEFWISFLAVFLATLIPMYVGFLPTAISKKFASKYFSAYALGISIWFTIDIVNDAAQLDANSGFSGGITHPALVGAFLVGLLIPLAVDKSGLGSELGSDREKTLFGFSIVPLLIAIALGFHSIGEGGEFAELSRLTSSETLIAALGGYAQGIGYVVHKVLEAMLIAASAQATGKLTSNDRRYLAAIPTLFTLVGSSLFYFIEADMTFLFALGSGAALYILFRLANATFANQNQVKVSKVKLFLALVLGFLSLYVAALVHSTTI